MAKKIKDLTQIEVRLNKMKKRVRTKEEIQAWEDSQRSDFDNGLQKEIEKYPPTSQQQYFSFMPSPMARTSPFFPLPRNEVKKPVIEEIVIKNSWGAMTIKGHRLCIYDETLLLALLHLVQKQNKSTIQTTKRQILHIMGIKDSGSNYKALKESFIRLKLTVITLEPSIKSKYEFKSCSILGDVNINTKGPMTVDMNEFFLKMFDANTTAYINLSFRNQLKGDCSKALYRFLKSQDKTPYSIGIITLGQSLNLINDNSPSTERIRMLRYQLRKACRELKKNGYLSRSLLAKNDVLTAWKSGKSNTKKLLK